MMPARVYSTYEAREERGGFNPVTGAPRSLT